MLPWAEGRTCFTFFCVFYEMPFNAIKVRAALLELSVLEGNILHVTQYHNSHTVCGTRDLSHPVSLARSLNFSSVANDSLWVALLFYLSKGMSSIQSFFYFIKGLSIPAGK